jgi:plasmid maintenance system antidote protein VapI
MAYRQGDPTVELEARIEVTTAKAYLIEPVMGMKKEVWLPKSQTVSMSDADENGNRTFVVTEWWHNKAELGE